MARRPVTRPPLATPEQINAAQGITGTGPTSLTTIDGFPGQTVMGNDLDTLDSKSADYKAMETYWRTVSDIVDGAEAMRLAHDIYLPKFPNETGPDYEFRYKNAKFTNVYRDILENLASKPFEQEITLIGDDLPLEFEDFVQDVDGAGNNISVFGADTFFNGINSAIDWIFVDYSATDPGTRPRTVRDEAQMGIRPFWTHVLGSNVLDVRSRVINGKETIYYMRIQEWEPEGKQIRIMRSDGFRAAWELYREAKAAIGAAKPAHRFEFVNSGPITINKIPMVPFITGRRKGRTFRFDPVMKDAADLQIELFQQESGLKNIETLAGFPMLVGTGVKPPTRGTGRNAVAETLATGPNVVLYGGSDGQTAGTWAFISPPAEILKFLLDHIKETINQLRELGRNPLTAQSGNLTVVTTAVAAKKGNSAAQMWGMGLKDALENALVLTGEWLNISQDVYDPEVNVFTDFDIDGQQTDIAQLVEARKNKEISRKTFWHELVRRGVLSGEFNPDEEEEALLDELVDAEGDDLTPPVDPPNDPPAVG